MIFIDSMSGMKQKMRRFDDVVNSPDLTVLRADPTAGFMEACLSDPKYESNPINILAGWAAAVWYGAKLDLISVTLRDRPPTEEEMYRVIDIFWEDCSFVIVHEPTEDDALDGCHNKRCVQAYTLSPERL